MGSWFVIMTSSDHTAKHSKALNLPGNFCWPCGWGTSCVFPICVVWCMHVWTSTPVCTHQTKLESVFQDTCARP